MAEAYFAEADREPRGPIAQVLRDYANHASTLATVVDAEAQTHHREADRVEAAAQRADARGKRGR